MIIIKARNLQSSRLESNKVLYLNNNLRIYHIFAACTLFISQSKSMLSIVGASIEIGTLVLFHSRITSRSSLNLFTYLKWDGPAPLYNLSFDSFLVICTSFVDRTRGIVCVVYLFSRLANYKDPCKRCVLAL